MPKKNPFSTRKYSAKSTMGSRSKTNTRKVSNTYYKSNRPNQGVPSKTVNR